MEESENSIKETIQTSNSELGTRIETTVENSKEILSKKIESEIGRIGTKGSQSTEKIGSTSDSGVIDSEAVYEYLEMLLDGSGNSQISIKNKPPIEFSIVTDD